MKQQIVLLSLVLAPLVACQALYKTVQPQWAEGEVHTSSEKVLYESILISLRKALYPVGSGADPGKREVVSGWYTSTSPFKSKGYRQMATVHYEKLADAVYLVRVRVQRETNESVRPLDPTAADWRQDEDDPGQARIILQYVQSNVGGAPIELTSESGRGFGDG